MESTQQYVKYLKYSGQMIEVFGLLSAIINGIIFILSITGGPLIPLNSAILLAGSIVGIIFVILGGKIRKGLTSKTKTYLLIVLVISALVFLANLPSSNSMSLSVPTILVVSSIIGLNAASKLSKK
jgi:hypothetical protein